MPRYQGETVPVRAGEVQVGYRLVHQDGADGWLMVDGVEQLPGGRVMLEFEDGAEETYAAHELLWRVAS